MKITFEDDNGKVTVYQHITDAYICVRQLEPMQGKKKQVALLPETKSYSWGSNVREITKEISQSLVELQEYLKNLPRGNNT